MKGTFCKDVIIFIAIHQHFNAVGRIYEHFKGLLDVIHEAMVTRFVDCKVLFIVVTGRRLTATTTAAAAAADGIANNPYPAIFDISTIGGLSAFFHKNSTSRCGGAKGQDTPR